MLPFLPCNGWGPCNAVLASAILTLWATVLRSFPILCKPPQFYYSIRRFHLHPQAAHNGPLRAGRGLVDKALHPWFTTWIFFMTQRLSKCDSHGWILLDAFLKILTEYTASAYATAAVFYVVQSRFYAFKPSQTYTVATTKDSNESCAVTVLDWRLTLTATVPTLAGASRIGNS